MEEISSSIDGLNTTEAEIRLTKYGPNELTEGRKKPAWMFFLEQFKDVMIIILMLAALISGIMGDIADTVIILVIVLLNAIIGFVQEYRAEQAIEALKKMASAQAQVIRDGKPVLLETAQLVPGDVVLLEAGNVVPADMRLLETYNFKIDESALTGESVAVDKSAEQVLLEERSLGDRVNMAYKTTLVTQGRGKGLVTGTGMQTEVGKIAGLLQQKENDTPLKRRMAEFGRKLSYIILLICLLLFVIGLFRGEEPLRMLLLSISLAVAAIPEALPALITIALARGAKRLVEKKALIRRLPAVETLGSVNFICSDKTGTLTQNKMKTTHLLESADVEGIGNIHPLFIAMGLNHEVKITGQGEFLGDSTEIALIRAYIERFGEESLLELRDHYPRVAELPFDSDRKCMTTVHRYGDRYLVLVKGATESMSQSVASEEDREKMENISAEWAAQGLRVLAFAYKKIDFLPEPFSYETIENELEFVGIAGMIDPPREEAAQAIAECKAAGIKAVMITGDHPETARAIAASLGILNKDDLALTGRELAALDDEQLAENIEKIAVYARVSPEQKLRIVKALQAKGHFLAMTGDGVNDAPSLKAANIGVAMGISGTDVSKEASQMILLDDNFATIVNAVREGRRIYDNIRKFIKYIMTCNGAEIWTIFMAPLIGLPNPLLPIHILWINLVTDGLPGLALAGEKEEEDVMRRPPRPTNESIFAGGIAYHILWVGILMAGLTLGTQAWAIKQGLDHWQTMVFTVLALSQLGHVLAIRSDKTALYRQGILSNLPLLGAVLLTFGLQLLVIYLPLANKWFDTDPLSWQELLICVGISAVLFHAVELEKWIKRKMAKAKNG